MTIITNHYLLFKSESDSEFELISLTLRITFFIASTARARSLDGRDYDQGKINIQRYILSAEIALTNFLPFSSLKLSPEVGRTDWGGLDYTAIHQILVSLISVTKCKKRVSINVTNIFCWLFLLFIIDLHIFLYTDIHSLMMLWRTDHFHTLYSYP